MPGRPMTDIVDPGLCADCLHARTVRGARTVFWSCARSVTDPAYPRYPSLPVLRCAGFEPAGAGREPDQTPPEAPS